MAGAGRYDYGAAGTGAGTMSTSSVGSVVTDTDEEEAKERAKEILQEFLRNKARAAEVERQLHRAFEENEGLMRLLQDKRYDMSKDKERHAKEAADLRQINQELQQKVEASKHEIRKVAQTCAQRTADTAVQLQNKEAECERLEEEVLAQKEHVKELRAELERVRVQRDELERARDELPEKARQRMSELARRILEISKEKAAADQMVLDGKDKIAATMRTVEEFRQMQRETDAMLQESERAREKERAHLNATVHGLEQELEMQATLYKKYVEALGNIHKQSGTSPPPPHLAHSAPVAHPVVPQYADVAAMTSFPVATPSQVGGGVPVATPQSAQMSALQQQLQQQLGMLEQKLMEKDQHCRELQDALGQTREQLEDFWKGSVRAKQQQHEQLQESQKESDFMMQQMRQDLEAAQDKIRALLQEKKSFDSLMELFEQVKQERDELRKDCFTASVEAETAKRTQAELNDQLRKQAIERAAQEKLAEELFKEKDAREQAERTLKMKEEQYQQEMQLKEKQMELHQDSFRQGQNAGRDEVELKMRSVEREKALVEEELQRARDEITRQADLLHGAKEECIQKDKEIKDWCSAFQTAEKHKVSMSLQHDELKSDKSAVQQEKVALDLRCGVLQQHVERLERQLREEQERSDRLTQAHAEKELALAQKELEFRDRELRLREQTSRQKDLLEKEHHANTAIEKQKINREIEMLQREAELRDQAQRREHERLLEQSAQEVAAKELEIATLKKELAHVRGQQGQLQQSLNSALGQVAALGHQYAQDQAVAAYAVSQPREGSQLQVSPRRGLSPAAAIAQPLVTHELRYGVSPQGFGDTSGQPRLG
eukprot:TRINITY_DN1184_c0_g2_i1.p1 TRINITY_DN1184_c0_g2~~TRINITY_DN1184_c0_g2_i1.p1  ORF type:complete len:836 (+),score=453.54 TRINITY_DN1184_c0_g2_i1:52-2559(+)